ncbi:MAG: adenylate/guanylate cyclase domain-containing protein [Thermodesulfobacteriota bacterium]|nr:adenylate/guanylate cyclase domain-containing protein [Thermodesulfobacteriota bacterium]
MNGLLFIDDEEGVRRSIVRALKKEPYKTYTAGDGEEGIKFIEENIYNISTVISDYKMPGLNGLETLSNIGVINPEITRIILTGYATMEAAILATNEGIDGFLTKPFDNIELRANIQNISVRKRMQQFISEQVYREIKNSPDALRPTYQEASILFADIRGFTRMSQAISPEIIVSYLNNNYFAPMGEIAYQFNGTVDKHIGDSIMVVFGAPVAYRDDAVRAVQTAVAMQKKAREIDNELKKKNGLRLRIGIGISTGKVFSGILGSLRKKEFTSIGMDVNIAARLQSMAKEGEILMTERTYKKLADGEITKSISTEELPQVTVKGVDEPFKVYRVNA